MGDDEVNRFSIRLAGVERKMDQLVIAIQGDDALGIDGLSQHNKAIRQEMVNLKIDVKSLKDDRKTLKGWVAGLSSAGGIGGFLGYWFSKN